jgi:hypothetical protein
MAQLKDNAGMVYSSTINETETYLLNILLKWKTFFNTPFDFIHIIIQRILREYGIGQAVIDLILSKAVQICELILLCNCLYPNPI